MYERRALLAERRAVTERRGPTRWVGLIHGSCSVSQYVNIVLFGHDIALPVPVPVPVPVTGGVLRISTGVWAPVPHYRS